jgi:SHS2 domain-containing protein
MGDGRGWSGYEYAKHVADVRIRAWGSGLEETLVAVTGGLWRYVLGNASVPITRSWEVSARGQDLEDALVGFLNEQIFLYESEGLLPASVKDLRVRGEHGAVSLRALFEGCLSNEMPTAPERQVKAATFHELVVRPELIEVTLDV